MSQSTSGTCACSTVGSLPYTPDLTKQAPRSPRVRLGGYAVLPRMLDKCRATLVGKSGDYHYNCPLDQTFLTFVGIDPEALKAEVAKGKGDGEILAWIEANAAIKRNVVEIAAWSTRGDTYGPTDFESREFFNGLLGGISKTRADIAGWFDLLDLDDYVTYGGKA